MTTKQHAMKLVPLARTDSLYPPETRLWVLARKSTAQAGDIEDRSNTRQIENATAFAASRLGLRADPSRVCADEGISGADTHKLVSRSRLLAGVRRGDVVVMRDSSRFSRRDGDEAFGELKRLAQSGVDVWFYQDGTPFRHGTFESNVSGLMRAEMNAEYRRQIARWVQESHARKVSAGLVAGKPTYGYRNVRQGPNHVIRVVDPVQRDIVRRAFARAFEGAGVRVLCREFNDEGIAGPTGRPWSTAVMRRLLANPLYRGEFIWNKTHARNVASDAKRVRVKPSEWIRVRDEDWRIVDDVLWYAVERRFKRAHERMVAVGAGYPVQRRRDRESEYLLTGFARCKHCGGPIGVIGRPALSTNAAKRMPKRPMARLYACKASRRDCPNGTAVPVDIVNREVMTAISAAVSRPTLERDVLAAVRAEANPSAMNTPAQRKRLAAWEREATGLAASMARSLARGVRVDAIETLLEERQRQIEGLRAVLHAPAVGSVDDLERRVRREIQTRRAMLGAGVQQVRAFLADVLVEPILVAAPDRKPYSRGTRVLSFAGRLNLRTFTGAAKVLHKDALSGQTALRWHLPFTGEAAA